MARKQTRQSQQEREPELPSPDRRDREPLRLPERAEVDGRLPGGMPARPVRQAMLLRSQQEVGNRATGRRFPLGRGGVGRPPAVQRVDEEEEEAAPETHPGGRGPGQVTGASESFYEVTGTTLHEVSPQLNHFDGFAAATTSDITLKANARPETQEDGSLRAEVAWKVHNQVVGLPRWTGYDTACPAAQQEWDRFMQQTRIHEQSAHVDMGNDFVENLGPDDTIITGVDRDDFVANLQAKHQELGERLQTLHDECDHGAAIDAILHPDAGRCAEPDADADVDGGEETDEFVPLEIE